MRSSLELLILDFVQQGLRTPYELKVRGGLSLGSTVPALARLEDEGLLKSSTPAARGSRGFEITKSGLQALKKSWKEPSEVKQADADGILRSAYLVMKYGPSSDVIGIFRAAAANLSGLAKIARAEAERFGSDVLKVNTETHSWLRSRTEAARLESCAAEFSRIAAEIELRLPRKRGSKQRSSSVRKDSK